MECPDESVFSRFVDGELAAGEAASVEAHVDACAACRLLLSELARAETRAALGGAPPSPSPPPPLAPVDDEGGLAPGQVLGERFRLTALLGRGGMGTVWEARHLLTQREVALKLVRGAIGERARRRLVREARISSAIEHPAVVPVVDAFELADGSPVLVMERLRGRSLRARLEAGGPMALGEAARVIGTVAEALAAAHAAGVVHRDLKPDNIFLCDGEAAPVRVLDFGIAKVMGGDSLDVTRTGELLGTPAYMAPEQLFGEPEVDAAADVWALGVTAYECLVGRRPFQASGAGALLKAIAAGPVLPLADPALPSVARPLITRMLAVDRKERAPLDEVRAGLARWSVASATGEAGATEVQVGAPSAAPPRSRALVVALAAVALLVAAAVGALALRAQRSAPAVARSAPPHAPPAPAPSTRVVAPAPSTTVAPPLEPAAALPPDPLAAPPPPSTAARSPTPRWSSHSSRVPSGASPSTAAPERQSPAPAAPARLPGGVIEAVPF
jgi:serine/threonine-protein kinase